MIKKSARTWKKRQRAGRFKDVPKTVPNRCASTGDVWLVRCDCGTEFYACGACIREGRITACWECEGR